MGGGCHYFMCTVHSASMTSYGCTQWAAGAYFYSLWLFTETQLRINNSILIRYHIVWLLVVIFSRRATREAMYYFPSDKKSRKEREDVCGRIKLPKDPLLFLSTLALMPFSRPQLHGRIPHISILFSELSIQSCVVVKITTGSSSSSPSATILRHHPGNTCTDKKMYNLKMYNL